MSQRNCSVLCWNVRGLNDGVKRASVRNLISASNATIVCLQETKIESWTQSPCRNCGSGFGSKLQFSSIDRGSGRYPNGNV